MLFSPYFLTIINVDRMDRACNTHTGGTRNDYIILAGECQGKRTLGRSKKRWNIRIFKKEEENGD